MDVLYELYDEDIQYDSLYGTQEENEIIDFLESHKEKNKFDLDISKNYNVYFQNELSSRNVNLINWYPIEKGKKVLEVIGRFGTITEHLLQRGLKVTCIETVSKRAKANNERNYSENLKVICTSNIIDLEIKEKYDYIILSNVIEKAKALVNNKDVSAKGAVKLLLNKMNSLLSDNGKILIYTDNKFAIRNFAGYKSTGSENSYSNIVGNNKNKLVKYFSKKEIIDILADLDIMNYKFYYLLPDCRTASVIYSDDYLPNSSSNKLKYNIYYNKFDTIVFNETDAIMQVTNSGYFDIFANSFLIELSSKRCDINFISFNNFRDKKYQLITCMEDGRIVKYAANDLSKNHINTIQKNIDILNKLNIKTLDSYEEECIFSKYTTAKSLDSVIADKLFNDNESSFINEIKRWYEFINEKLIKNDNIDEIKQSNIFSKYNIDIDEKILKKFTFAKTGLIDIIFENIFVIDNEYYIYDQEWYEENVPFEFILYRAIQSLYFHSSKIQYEVEKQELFKLFNIDEDSIKIFEKLEKEWQESIIDREIINYFESTYSALTTLESLKNRCADADFYFNIMNIQQKEVDRLTNENNILISKLKKIEESPFWKAYKKIIGDKNE